MKNLNTNIVYGAAFLAFLIGTTVETFAVETKETTCRPGWFPGPRNMCCKRPKQPDQSPVRRLGIRCVPAGTER